MTLDKQQKTSSFLPSYIKSYSQTRFESITFDYVWTIENFKSLADSVDTLNSPPFPESGKYSVKMNISRETNGIIIFKLYIYTDAPFVGLCTTVIKHPPEKLLSSNIVSGRISSESVIHEFSRKSYELDRCMFMIHCKIEIFHQLINKTIHMNLTPRATSMIFKDMTFGEDPLADYMKNKSSEKSIKFIIGDEQYIMPKKSLYSTNSSYFRNICLTHEGNKKDMKDELAVSEVSVFKQILLYILTGSVDRYDYDKFKELLIAADKYDISSLKFMCEHHLLRYITKQNAVELIKLAFSYNAKFLETHVATVIKFHIKEIVRTKEFRDLSLEESNKIMDLMEQSKTIETRTEFSSLY